MMQQIVIAQTHLTARPGFHRQIFGQKNSLGRSPDRWFGQRVVAAQSGTSFEFSFPCANERFELCSVGSKCMRIHKI